MKIKPLLVYQADTKRAEGYVKQRLPVVWHSNPKVWVMQAVSQDSILDYFSPFVERYTKDNNLDNKCLLVIDNAPGYSTTPEDSYCNVEPDFLPTNTTSILQPMDQGARVTFKKYYT